MDTKTVGYKGVGGVKNVFRSREIHQDFHLQGTKPLLVFLLLFWDRTRLTGTHSRRTCLNEDPLYDLAQRKQRSTARNLLCP